jgi:hypothetical protein
MRRAGQNAPLTKMQMLKGQESVNRYETEMPFCGGGVGSLPSESRQYVALNLTEYSSANVSFLDRLSCSLPILVPSLSQGTGHFHA